MRRAVVVGTLSVLLLLACGDATGPGVASLVVAPDAVFLVPRDSVRLTVDALDGSGHLVIGISVSFEAADPTLIEVSAVGLVRSLGPTGSTIVRVSGAGKFTDVPVAVIPFPIGVRITPSDTVLRPGRTMQYVGQVLDGTNQPIPGVPLRWQSSDTTIAQVNASGLATSRGPAGVTFVFASFRGYGAAGRLRVATPGIAESLRVTPADTAISASTSVQLRASVRDAFGDSVATGSVTWESLNPAVVTVSATGLAHSEGPVGTAVIRASSGSLVASASVTVLDSLISARVRLGGRPYGAALSSGGVAYITLVDASQLARTDLPSQAFAPAVAVSRIPTEVAFNSTGTRAYATNQFSQNVSVVNVASNTVIDSIPVAADPFEVIVEPGDSIIYVSTNAHIYVSTNEHRVYAIRLATKTVITSFATPAVGNGMLIRDTLLYVSTHTGGTVIEFNLRTRTVARTFTVGGIPQKMALSADRNTLFVANEAGYVQFWNLVSGTQDGANLALPAGSAGYGIARRASDGRLYVTTAYFGSAGGSVHVIDPVSRTLVYTAATGGSTRDITFNASGSIGFVPNESGWVDFLK